MALNASQELLYKWLKSSLPSWAFTTSLGEAWESIAVVFDAVRTLGYSWARSTFILEAQGSWLDLLARDWGTARRLGESDDSLRDRLRNPEDAVTEPALEAGADGILAAMGTATGAKIVSLRMDCARFVTYAATGRKDSYLSRGYRMSGSVWPTYPGGGAVWAGNTSAGRRGSGIIAILPYGTTAASAATVLEMLRTKHAGGYWFTVERRLVP